MRFDVLLHQLRLFKSRTQAAAAIAAGEARLDGEVVKPSHAVTPGRRVTLVGPSGSRVLEVIELPGRSVSKETARALVREVREG